MWFLEALKWVFFTYFWENVSIKKVWSILRFQVHSFFLSNKKYIIWSILNSELYFLCKQHKYTFCLSKCSRTHSKKFKALYFSTLLGFNVSKDNSDYHFWNRVYLILIVMTSRRYVFCSQSTTRSFDFMFVFSSLNKYVIQSCVVR